MKNFETSIPSIAVYNLIFLSMMVFFTWRISSRFYPYGKKILFMHLLINLIPTFYSLSIGLDSYLDTLIAYVLFLGPTLVLYRHSPLWAMTSYIAMFASQTLSEFLVYLVCALIWNMSTVDVSAAHPMLIYIAYFICGMGSLYGVYRFMLQFTTLESLSAMSMVEQGLGMSVMNKLITERRVCDIVMLPVDPPASITLGIALHSKADLSPAVRMFLKYAVRMLTRQKKT